MPVNAMQKFSTRYGCMLSCAWPPPVLLTVDAMSEVVFASGA